MGVKEKHRGLFQGFGLGRRELPFSEGRENSGETIFHIREIRGSVWNTLSLRCPLDL